MRVVLVINEKVNTNKFADYFDLLKSSSPHNSYQNITKATTQNPPDLVEIADIAPPGHQPLLVQTGDQAAATLDELWKKIKT